ncbi:MAG: DUF1330 domain-containing protein [SAR324 cluster bacterium]|nr:DUF1330 domain-containing protein [SAR324 cluster bacterium]
MAAFLIGHVTVKDDALWQEYVAGVKESLVPFESKIIFRGRLESVLAGKHEHELVVIIEFDEHATLESWYTSEKYQSLIPLRDKATNVAITSYTG